MWFQSEAKAKIVVVIVIAAAVVGGYLLIFEGGKGGGEGGKEGEGGGVKIEMPVYPGASKVDIPQKWKILGYAGITHKAYDVDVPLNSVKKWYENKMSDLGWTVENTRVLENYITVLWSKDDSGAGISLYPKERQLIPEYAELFDNDVLETYTGYFERVKSLLFPTPEKS